MILIGLESDFLHMNSPAYAIKYIHEIEYEFNVCKS
jgi:hypothetical protein